LENVSADRIRDIGCIQETIYDATGHSANSGITDRQTTPSFPLQEIALTTNSRQKRLLKFGVYE
jgi:hypothetical protein